MRWSCALSLMCVATGVSATELQDDADFAAAVAQTERQLADVERQLIAAHGVAGLLAMETEQRELYVLETRAKMEAGQEAVREEVRAARKEVAAALQAVVENATDWEKRLEQLRAVNEKNRARLQRAREQEEEKEMLQVELERLEAVREKKVREQRELQKRQEEMLRMQREEKMRQEEEELRMQVEAEKQAEHRMQELKRQEELRKQLMQKQEELRKQQEQETLRKQQEAEKQATLQKQQEAKRQEELRKQKEKQRQEEQQKQKLVNTTRDEGVQPSEADISPSIWKHFVSWYLSAEQVVHGAVAAVYRQLVLPVVAILVFFLVMTVGIARYNAAELARRKPRVLYSGYPKSYRRKTTAADAAGLRQRRAVLRRDQSDFVGN